MAFYIEATAIAYVLHSNEVLYYKSILISVIQLRRRKNKTKGKCSVHDVVDVQTILYANILKYHQSFSSKSYSHLHFLYSFFLYLSAYKEKF